MPTKRALRNAAGVERERMSVKIGRGRRDEPSQIVLLYATTVCSQLTQTPLNRRRTPPSTSLSLYLVDSAIMGRLVMETFDGRGRNCREGEAEVEMEVEVSIECGGGKRKSREEGTVGVKVERSQNRETRLGKQVEGTIVDPKFPSLAWCAWCW